MHNELNKNQPLQEINIATIQPEIKPKKHLGQNFLIQSGVIDKILNACDLTDSDTVLELGSGMGALTNRLAGLVRRVIAVEIDSELVSFMEEQGIPNNLELINADMLKLDLSAIAEQNNSLLKIIGNLPYYISTQVVFHLIKYHSSINWAVLMFQKEVADRLLAMPGTKDYGIPTVLLKCYADIEKIMDLAPGNFYPPPKVFSSVLKITFRPPLWEILDGKMLSQVVKISFAKRRKTIKNNLKGFSGLDTKHINSLLELCGIDPKSRAETISPQKFSELANLIYQELHGKRQVSR